MKNLFLCLLLAIAPVAIMPPVLMTTADALAAASVFGDLFPMQAIVADALNLAKAGDLDGAEKRITDYETAWDAAEPTLRPMDIGAWTRIDHASDIAIEALRSGSPAAETVVPPLQALVAALGNPATASAPAAVSAVAFAVTNADGSPVPCETVLAELRRVSGTTSPAASDQAKFDELQAKGIERCNADDDTRADKFLGDALTLLQK